MRRTAWMCAAALALGVILAGAAIAQPAAAPGVAEVLACRDVRGDKAQLACFRRAADLLAQAPAVAGAAVAQAPPPPRPFGAPAPKVARQRIPQPHAAQLVVRSIGDMGDGRAILNLEDGSTWIETEAEPITSAVKAGDRIRLEKGALGGYFLVLEHRAGIHVVRLRTEGR